MKNWITQIDQTTAVFQTSFGKLTEQELNWKPNADTWSIAQNIDHLITINRTYFPILSALKTGKYRPHFMTKFGFLASFFGNMLLQAVQPTTEKKIKTFTIWEPATSQISRDILDRFTQHQEQLKQEMETAKEFVKKGTVISSPANKYIVYKLTTAFDIMVVHEQRHLEQARRVLSALKKEGFSDEL